MAGLTNPAQDEPPRPTTRNITEGIEWVIAASSTGLAEQIGDWIPREAMTMIAYSRNVARYAPAVFQNILTHVQGRAHEKARRLEIALTYGDAVQDIWERYRADVEPAIAQLGLEDHFLVIRDGIRSDNPEQWRAAMWACRSVLESLAATLWKDPNPTYPPITNERGQAISVAADKPINRLIAYLHCKGVTGTTRTYVASELDRLVTSLHGLHGLDSKAHSGAPVEREDAQLAVVGTYTMLSQFVRRTDLRPVTDQANCAADESNGTATSNTAPM
jgi:hypothetical protein